MRILSLPLVAVLLAATAAQGESSARLVRRSSVVPGAARELLDDWRELPAASDPALPPAPEVRLGPLDVPPGAIVEVSVALEPATDASAGPGERFELAAAPEPAAGELPAKPGLEVASGATASAAEARDAPRRLAVLELDPARRAADRGWHELRADLGAYAGRRLTIIVRATAACSGAPAVSGSVAARDAASPVEACEPEPVAMSAREVTGVAPQTGRGSPRPLISAPRLFAPEEHPSGRRNLLLVSIDTLRADRLGVYGSERPTSPALDALAARGVRFVTAIAPATSTGPSHMTMLTGTLPCRHGVWGVDPAERLPADIPTLAERLARGGYATAAFTEDAYIGAPFGFARGFDSFRERKDPLAPGTPAGAAPATFAAAMDWLTANRDKRFFLFVHTYEVHGPRRPAGEYARLFGGPDDTRVWPAGFDPAFYDLARYDRLVREADDWTGRLLDLVERLGLSSDTLVVVTSDHGEEFFEHGDAGHGFTAYDELARVPLIVSAPGLAAPGMVRRPVGLVDLVPSLLELLGLPAAAGLDGASFAGLVRSTAERDDLSGGRAFYIETGPGTVRALRSARFKLMRWEEPRRYAAFDLVADPHEWRPLDVAAQAGAAPSEIGRLRRELDEQAERCIAGRRAARSRLQPDGAATEAATTGDAARRAKLRALGYVE